MLAVPFDLLAMHLPGSRWEGTDLATALQIYNLLETTRKEAAGENQLDTAANVLE